MPEKRKLDVENVKST